MPLKFVAISDTHGKHSLLNLPAADMIIHAGDISGMGKRNEVIDFLEWYSALPFQHKVLIAGNHDFFFEQHTASEVTAIMPPNIHYLNDTGIEIEGVHIWGSPISPWFYDWAFNRYRGAEIKKHWEKIPSNTNILITHGPPYGILDRTVRGGELVGCEDLLESVKRIVPAFHIFGHIHEGYGMVKREGTTFVNASVLNEKYQLVNKPFIFEI